MSSDVSQEVKEIFFAAEDWLLEKSILFGVAPESMLSVTLSPEFYFEDGEQKMKCTIAVECSEDVSVDDDTLEAISDTVSDHFNDSEFKDSLSELGYSDVLDWWPVKIINAN